LKIQVLIIYYFQNRSLSGVANIDIDYQINVVMTINKTLSATLTYQTIYDHNAYQGFQTRQVFGLGVNYGF
jgi:hypothetical protein